MCWTDTALACFQFAGEAHRLREKEARCDQSLLLRQRRVRYHEVSGQGISREGYVITKFGAEGHAQDESNRPSAARRLRGRRAGLRRPLERGDGALAAVGLFEGAHGRAVLVQAMPGPLRAFITIAYSCNRFLFSHAVSLVDQELGFRTTDRSGPYARRKPRN